MKRLVYGAVKNAGSIVNKVGKYLNNNIDGAFKISFHPMECEILSRMYYQVPGDPDTFDEMIFSIDIVSYQNRLRVNLTEQTDMEKTIGQIIVTEDELHDLSLLKKKILTRLERFIKKEYEGYEIVY